ncbi:hypothetical protein VBD025_02705 [Virgibacillus flavescens]|uniref:hypothetical protein n=1 Tax=Virgibacillus flavescens TaxID=1611422 RepID=UPI003D352824
MLKLEEYLARRKIEDKLNEFDVEERMENMRICVNYVFEYFNQYLQIDEMEQKTFINNERLEKFRKQLHPYDQDVQDWLVSIYDDHEKHLHRSVISIIKKNNLFLLYFKEDEFRSCSYDCYSELIKKNSYLRGQTEMLFRFIKNYHRIQSQGNTGQSPVFLTEEIDEWVNNTWAKYKVNIWAFVSDYANRFFDDVSMWPVKHRIKTNEDWMPYDYDYRQKNNLFNLNMLYPKISKNPFIRGKKQFLENMLMYEWLHSIVGDEENYWEEYFSNYVKDI